MTESCRSRRKRRDRCRPALVQLRHSTLGPELVGVFLREYGEGFDGDVGGKGGFGTGQMEFDRQVVDLFDGLDQFGKAHGVAIIIARAGDIVIPGVLLVDLTAEREDHVVGVHLAGWCEEVRRVEFDALAKFEGVFLAVVGNRPAFGGRRNRIGGARLEFDEHVVNIVPGGVESGGRGVKARIEPLRRRLEHQTSRLRARRGGQQGPGEQSRRPRHANMAETAAIPFEKNRFHRNFSPQNLYPPTSAMKPWRTGERLLPNTKKGGHAPDRRRKVFACFMNFSVLSGSAPETKVSLNRHCRLINHYYWEPT